MGWRCVHAETFCWTQTSQVPNFQGGAGAIQEVSWTWFSSLKPAEPLAPLHADAAPSLCSQKSSLVACGVFIQLVPRSEEPSSTGPVVCTLKWSWGATAPPAERAWSNMSQVGSVFLTFSGAQEPPQVKLRGPRNY